MKRLKLIELWKPNCEDCEAAEPVISELEKEGFEFEKHNIAEPSGQKLWDEYAEKIDEYSKLQGWEAGYIYTPTFINPKSGKVIVYANRPPTKEELIGLAGITSYLEK